MKSLKKMILFATCALSGMMGVVCLELESLRYEARLNGRGKALVWLCLLVFAAGLIACFFTAFRDDADGDGPDSEP